MQTIRRFSNSADAYVIKGLLESEGIECLLLNANVVQLMPIGDIELQVADHDVEKATAILKDADL